MTFEVTRKIQGQEYRFAYDWDAQIKAEELTGMNILSPQGLAPSAILRATVLARLLHHHPEMTISKVTDFLRTNLGIIAEALNEIGEYQNEKETCSFCGKDRTQVTVLISAPSDMPKAFICPGCALTASKMDDSQDHVPDQTSGESD